MSNTSGEKKQLLTKKTKHSAKTKKKFIKASSSTGSGHVTSKISNPKSVAKWFIDNTTLTFEQIAEFCGLYTIEIKAIADGVAAKNLLPYNPIANSIVSELEIIEAQKDPKKHLKHNDSPSDNFHITSKKTHYIPTIVRKNRPYAILWFIENHAHISDSTIIKFLGTTKATINKVRAGSTVEVMSPKDPVTLGLCRQSELDKLLEDFQIV